MRFTSNGSRTHGVVVSTLVAVLGVCAYPTAALAEQARGAKPARGYRIVTRPFQLGPAPAALPNPLVYLNRSGGTFRPGYDDASTNHSSILGEAVTLSPFQGTENDWLSIVDCVRSYFAPYDIRFTDEAPSEAHLEAVVAGSSSEMGSDFAGNLGVAPLDAACAPIERAVVYTFATDHGGDLVQLCLTTVHEIGHALGLDHVFFCADPMSYLEGCTKTFQDRQMLCGESGVRPCACGGDTQNSVAHLRSVLNKDGNGPGGGGGGGMSCTGECAALGNTCELDSDCASGSCGRRDGEARCTATCDPVQTSSCPVGFDCVPTTAGAGACWPQPSEGGGCSATPSSFPTTTAALLALLLFARIGRRRPESATERSKGCREPAARET